MSIETNLNQSPYFDDYDENKNFHRVLFRPGYAVQARELTQLQTILQNQVERFANRVVYDGKIVSGVGIKTETVGYVKLRDKDANNRVLLLGDFYQNAVVANAFVYGETTGMTAQLIDVAEGSEAAAPNYLTLFVKYINSGTDTSTKVFSDNEVLNVRLRANNHFLVAGNTIASSATGQGFRATVNDGIIYHKGNFIRVAPQGIIVDKYTTTPTKKLGFETRESIVDSNQDSSLLDNATGATNFSAPGATRLKLTPTLAVRDFSVANTTTFFSIADIEEGRVTQRVNDELAGINALIADRIYDTNGDFVTQPFNIRVREHLKREGNLGRYTDGDVDKLVAEIETGTGYVNGNKIEILETVPRDFQKATAFEVKDARVIGQAFGNYVFANEVVGTWDFQGLRTVSLRDAQQQGISGKNFGAQTVQGSEIGTARVRGFQWDSGSMGTAQGRFRIYLFDVQMNSGKSFADVRGMYVDNSSGPKSMADLVLEADGSAKIQEASLNRLVFPFTQSGTKTLRDENNNVDTQFVFRTEKTVNFDSAGTATVAANSAHAGGTESLNDTGTPLTNTDERNIIIVSRQAVQTEPHDGQIGAIAGNTITGNSGANFTTTYSIGDIITISDGANTYNERVTEILSPFTLKVANTIPVTRTGAGLAHRTTFPTGYIWDMSNGGEINSTTTQHQINLGQANLTSTFAASVYFDILRSDANPTLKVVNKNKYVHINTGSHSAGANGPWHLGVSDAYKLHAVYMGSNTGVTTSDTDVTHHFELDTGMKDALYDTAAIRKKVTSTLDVSDSGLLVEFSYFTRDRSSGIGFLSVDSYPVDDINTSNTNAITTSDIPVFVSPSTGQKIDLRDAVDFRPIKNNSMVPSANAVAVQTPSITNPSASTTYNIDSDGSYMPTPDQNFQTDIQFYLPRKDRIVLTAEGAIEVIQGVPSINPNKPDPRAGSMTLATLNVPVYPSLSPSAAKQANRLDYSVQLEVENNRRYTMKDLRAVESRVKNLEYYSSLNSLEVSAKNKQIFGSTGIDRFKNGFLVDNFNGHNQADRDKVGYRAAIDAPNSVMRPSFVRTDVSLTKDLTLTSSNVKKTGNIVTLDYTHTPLVTNRFASKLRNPVQEVTFNWKGEIILDPPMDNTPDITTLPDVQIDFDGMYEAIEEIASRAGVSMQNIDWGNWRTTDVNRTQRGRRITTQTDQIREGLLTTISPVTESFSIGNFVENVAVRDFMRSRLIRFTGTRMKPQTQVYPYFDGESVSAYCTPANSSFANTAAEGSALTTDSNGNVFGVFRLPNDDNLKFRIGTRRFVLKDVANTAIESDLLTTSAFGDYTSISLDIQQRGADISLTLPQVSREQITDNRTLTRVQILPPPDNGNDGGGDPMTQTFTINAGTSEGAFITKLDLFFGRKSSTYPITVQIREVENGFPTNTIVPFGSKTLQPSEVSANNVGTGGANDATSFEFDAPIFLKNKQEYCFTVIPAGDNEEYALWVGELGGIDVDTTELIHKQPSSGILFSSANDRTWSPIQSEDIKFTLHRANFTSSTGTLYLENDNVDYFSYDTLSGTFNVGEKVTNGAGQSGFVRFIDLQNQKIHIESSTGGFGAANTITGSVTGATAVIDSIENVLLNTIVPKIPQIVYAGAQAGWSARTTSTSGVIGSNYVEIDLEVENDFLDGEKKVFSKTNESGVSAVDGSNKTLVLKGTFTTDDPYISPIVDLSRATNIVLGNIINNDATDEHKEVGSAAARYLGRPVTLADGQDAEDLRVLVTAYKPQGTDVKVYARIHNPEDSEGIDLKDYTPLTQLTAANTYSDSVDDGDYKEFEFGFSANTDGQGFLVSSNSHARLNSSNNNVVAYKAGDGSIHHTYKTFAIKIVMTSTGSEITPIVRDMRAIALQQ